MVMTLTIGLILASIALPVMVGAIQSYRLNSMAQQVANLIDLTRYTAIRRNTTVSMHLATLNGNTFFYIDLNGDGQQNNGEPMVLLPNDMQIATGDKSMPPSPTTTQNFTDTITFDYRGTVNYPIGGAIGGYFLPLEYINQAQYGYRAITVVPMGQTKMWKATSGTWTGM